ncbi:MAG: hypothetical protein PHQ64_00495 [Bacilli bacterium]|nr:hypothetical protein [Bacilli bacterium]
MDLSSKKVFINYKYFLVLPIILLVYFVFGFYNYNNEQSKIDYNVENNKYLQSSFSFDKEEGYMDLVDIIDTKPISDLEAADLDGYKFSVKNIYEEAIDYVIKIVPNEEMIKFDNCADNLIDSSYLRYKLDNQNNRFFLENEQEILYKGHLEKGSSNIHILKIWVTNLIDGATINRHFHGKIQISRIND